jgi:hypothetical protein
MGADLIFGERRGVPTGHFTRQRVGHARYVCPYLHPPGNGQSYPALLASQAIVSPKEKMWKGLVSVTLLFIGVYYGGWFLPCSSRELDGGPTVGIS